MRNHLDPDTLAAFGEQALGDSEVAAVFTHLAECQHCRNWFEAYTELRPTRRRTPVWIAPAALACALVVFLAIGSRSLTHEKAKATPTASLIFAHDLTRPSSSPLTMLPRPLASARLGSQVSFLTHGLTQPIHQTPLYSRISLKTNLGVRSISLSLIRAPRPGL